MDSHGQVYNIQSIAIQMSDVSMHVFRPTSETLNEVKRFVLCSTVAIVVFVSTICGLTLLIYSSVRHSNLMLTLDTTDWNQETQNLVNAISIVETFIQEIESKQVVDTTIETLTLLNKWVGDAASNHTIDKIIRLVNRLDQINDQPVAMTLAQRLMGLA